jgi:hypothetical protein
MRWGKISVEGEAEETAVSPTPRSRQRHGKGSNPYSTTGLDKFENVYAELSARREYILKNTGAPEALVRFTYWNNRWVPVVVKPREGIWKQNSGGGAAGISILGPVENNNSEKHRGLGRKDEFSIITASPRAVKPKNMSPEHNRPRHQSKAKKMRRVVAVDYRPTRPASEVHGSYRRTRKSMAYDTSVSATVVIITLFCLVFSGRLCAVFFTSAWWYFLPMLRKYEKNQ